MKTTRLRRYSYRFILGLAYLTCLLQWLWVGVIGLPPLLSSGSLDWLINPAEVPAASQAYGVEPSPVVWIFAGIVTIVMIVITIFVLVRLPRAVASTGHQLVHRTTEAVVPIMTHHKKLPAKKRRQLSKRVMLIVQLSLSLMPLVISLLLPSAEGLPLPVMLTVSIWLATFSLIGFVTAWLIDTPDAKSTSRTRSRASRG